LAIRGMKSKIALNVALLVLLSAVITDVLVVVLVQNLWVREHVASSRNTLASAGQLLAAVRGGGAPKQTGDPVSAVATLVEESGIQTLLAVDNRGDVVMQLDDPAYPLEKVRRLLDLHAGSGNVQVEELGLTWAAFWWQPEAVGITMPAGFLKGSGLRLSAIVVLTPIYKKLRQYNKPILFYIAINTSILTLIGLYRIFRIYLRPIDRIVRQADDYHEDGDLFFAFRQEDNELNRLSLSLNRMLNRIKDDKNTLEATVTSLEKANTDLKGAQNDILRAEKMASVGRLAAGIAHEIGNPIGIVLGYLEMLNQDDLDADDKVDFLKRTESEVQRINTIIRQLLDLARPKDSHSQNVALHSLLEDITDVLRLQPLMASIRIELDLAAEQDSVWGNEEQLRQIFLNLLLNAADAIAARADDNDGAIRIRTRCVAAPDDHQPGRHIQVGFEDNGVGMSSQQMANIFDPFFTTKEPGKGTGLGLAVSYMIVERLGGSINARSEAGRGSTLTVEIPLYSKASDRAPQAVDVS
jgi:two-component system, NtrC family, sensor kinase